jgi:epsilon-lactone hydrolase
MSGSVRSITSAVPIAVTESRPFRRDILPPTGLHERMGAFMMRSGLRMLFKPFVRPPFPVWVHRAVVHILGSSMPALRHVAIQRFVVDGQKVERITSSQSRTTHAILFLHGGAFCSGSPRSHRSITTRLAHRARCEVWAPHYRLVPEHPFPAQIDDAVSVYRAMLAAGHDPQRIAVGGDSAGGTLTLLLQFALRREGLPLPRALLLLSPAVDTSFSGKSIYERQSIDPLLNRSWGEIAMKWYAAPHEHPLADPLKQNYDKLPAMLIQVGEHEILYDDSVLLADKAAKHGNDVDLEVYLKRWHVFQIHGSIMPGSEAAINNMVSYLDRKWSANA